MKLGVGNVAVCWMPLLKLNQKKSKQFEKHILHEYTSNIWPRALNSVSYGTEQPEPDSERVTLQGYNADTGVRKVTNVIIQTCKSPWN